MSMRVMHVVVAGDIGGAERLLVDLASRPALSNAEHAIALMTPNPKLRAFFANAGLRIHDRGPVRENPLAYLWRSFGPADVAWLAHLFAREQTQIAHLHTFQSHVVGTRAGLRAGIKLLRTEHHVQYFIDPSTKTFTRWSLGKVDSVVAISDYVRDFVAGAVPSIVPKMRVVRNGVDADYFAKRPFVDASAPSDRPFTFAVVCRLEPWKQVDLVVEAVAQIPGVALDIVGDGSERARLEALARSRGVADRVHFLGYQRDPRDAMAAADACVNSSRDEPLGLSVLESQAIGRPVVAFAGGGIPEVVIDGETGWLVRERGAIPLANRMRDASADRARARVMGEAARRHVDASCRIEAMCEGYGKAYAALV